MNRTLDWQRLAYVIREHLDDYAAVRTERLRKKNPRAKAFSCADMLPGLLGSLHRAEADYRNGSAVTVALKRHFSTMSQLLEKLLAEAEKLPRKSGANRVPKARKSAAKPAQSPEPSPLPDKIPPASEHPAPAWSSAGARQMTLF